MAPTHQLKEHGYDLQAAAAQAGISSAARIEIKGFSRGGAKACPEQKRHAERARAALASLAMHLMSLSVKFCISPQQDTCLY